MERKQYVAVCYSKMDANLFEAAEEAQYFLRDVEGRRYEGEPVISARLVTMFPEFYPAGAVSRYAFIVVAETAIPWEGS